MFNGLDLVPPCSYQGGKQRLALQIADIIEDREGENFIFYDLCCGSGAVSLEMINRNHNVIMVDKGPFGAVWEKIGKCEFNLEILKSEIDKLPEREVMGEYLRELSEQSIDFDLYVYQYLLLQSGAFGGKQIWNVGDKWCNNTFRNYWKPTETSNRKSPVNPMIPMPDTLYSRVSDIVEYGTKYITAYHKDVLDMVDIINNDSREKVIYIDPPYMNTTGYFNNFNIYELIKKLDRRNPIYISEGIVLDNAEGIVLSSGRKKGNISGKVKKNPVVEILNYFEKQV
jgi:site-specific DNA-adenine methylase